jgi:PAP2 superfamily
MGFVKRRVARQWAMVVIVALAAPMAAAPTVGAVESPNEVTNWNRIAVETLNAFPPPAGGAPPAGQVNMAMTQGAVYDAVNAITQAHQPYLLETQFDPAASKNAAVATAAYRVLTDIATTVPATIGFPNQGTLLARLDTEYAASLGAIPPSQAKTDGIAAGNAAADAMIAARQGDGRFGPSQWDPDPDPGHWQPLLRPDGTQILDPTAWVGGVDPFLMTSSSQFRTDGPQSLTSEAWADDYNEVKAIGRVDSTTRTPEQTHIAIFWQSTPVATWNAVARDLAGSADHGVGVADSARLFAMLNLTAADSAINCWNDKYFWDFWRPWNAIPRGDEDGNPDTEADPSWTALITAPYPEHPSGHLCLDGAYLTVLKSYFRSDKIPFQVTSVGFPGEVRTFDRFSHALKEIIDARIWAGLHYRTADIQSVILGRKVAHYMEKHYFQPLDK